MGQVRIEQVDALTGEILEGATLAVFYPKRKNGFQQGGWFAMAQGPLMELARSDLSRTSWRVLAGLLAKLDYENWINVSQAALARDLGMGRQNLGKAVADLVDRGIVLRGPKVNGQPTFRLEPGYGWKGSAKLHHEAMQARIKAAGLEVVEGGAPR